MNGMNSDLRTILENNRASVTVFTLLKLLVELGVERAIYVHTEDVHDYVERMVMIASWKSWE